MTYDDKQALIMGFGIAILYLLRNYRPFDTIWAVIKIFLFAILLVVSIGLIGNGVKGWWKK